MYKELDPVIPDVEVIRDAQSYIKENGKSVGCREDLTKGFAEVASARKGAEVDLAIVSPIIGSERVDMGRASFDGFEKNDEQCWQGVFVLQPEGIIVPIDVESFVIDTPAKT